LATPVKHPELHLHRGFLCWEFRRVRSSAVDLVLFRNESAFQFFGKNFINILNGFQYAFCQDKCFVTIAKFAASWIPVEAPEGTAARP
jgi:hypothetical protein